MSVNTPGQPVSTGQGAYQPAEYQDAPRNQATSRHQEPASTRAVETKAAFKTTEFIVYVVAVVAVLIASYLVDDSNGGPDVFAADQAWLYVTLLTIGYMISRGLAKAGSRQDTTS